MPVDVSPGTGVVRFTIPARAGSLVFVALGIGVIGTLPVLAPGPPSPLRWLTFAVLAAVTTFFLFFGIRRSGKSEIDGVRRELVHGGRRYALGPGAAFELTGNFGTVERPRAIYSVTLATDGMRRVLLEGTDPAIVLSDLRTARAALELPIRAGWSLAEFEAAGSRDTEALGARAASSRAAVLYDGGLAPGQRQAGWSVASVAVLIATVWGRSVHQRVTNGTPATWVSYAAPIAVVASLTAIAVFMLSSRTVLRSDGVLRAEKVSFGIPFARRSFDIRTLQGIRAVGPVPGRAFHVLLDFGTELLALPAPAGDAELRARELREALTGSVRGPAPRGE